MIDARAISTAGMDRGIAYRFNNACCEGIHVRKRNNRFQGYLLILKEGLGNKEKILFLYRKGGLVHLNILTMIVLSTIFTMRYWLESCESVRINS